MFLWETLFGEPVLRVVVNLAASRSVVMLVATLTCVHVHQWYALGEVRDSSFAVFHV